MKRRDLLRLGAKKAVQTASRLAQSKTGRRAESWLRPPYAVDEMPFLLGCTRCGKCIEACPHEVLFGLPAHLGQQVADTPVMGLLDRGCRMCDDWPCVTACEPAVMKLPDRDGETPPAPPRLARAQINIEICLPYSGPECGACAHACPVPGALEWEGGIRPVINQEHCTGCAMCHEACITEPKAVDITAIIGQGETRPATGRNFTAGR
jgi:ferredoxin-type protein NapG